MAETPSDPNLVLDFWFAEGMPQKWFFAGAHFDAELRSLFGGLHKMATQGALSAWQESREGRLATIIVLDQFSRNIYRDQAQAYAYDHTALALAKHALRMGDDLWFKAQKQQKRSQFLYLPLMHSESLEDQRRCVDLHLTHLPEVTAQHARNHLDVIARFGRFPSRNHALGRISTPEEVSFLNVGGGNWSQSAQKA